VTVTNSSASSLSISKISASGNYTATGNGATPCGSTLVAGAKCTLAVTFAPSINGTIKGAITIANSTTVSPQVYNLSGTGVLPLTFSPASITFAGRPVGTTSPPVTVSLKNNQSTALTITFATSGQYKAVPSGTSPCGASLAGSATCTLSVTFTPAAAGSIKGVSTFAYTGGSFSPIEMKLTGTGQDFKLSASPTSLAVSRGNSGDIQVSVTPLSGFTGTVTVSASGLPAGVTSAPVGIAAGSTGTLVLNVSVPTANGKFPVSLKGTSGTLSHGISVTLGIPLGGGVLTIVPRTSGSNAFPSDVAAYLASMETDVAPVRLAECGTASGSYTVEMLYDPSAGSPEFSSSGSPLIIYVTLLTTSSPKHCFDYNVHETAHALQYDLLHLLGHRGTQAEIEGFARGCTDRVYRDLALAAKDAPRTGGDDRVLWMDILRRFDPEILAAGGWSSSAPHVQPEQSLGEAVYLLTASRPVAGGINGLIEHENAYFAAVPFPTPQNPPSPEDRIKIWDSLSYHLDGQTPGSWMPSEMIQDPDFTPEIGKPKLIAWPEYPQFPAQMMAQAFTITGTDGFNHPTVQPVASGPLTITVKDATPLHKALLTIPADFSETTGIANFTPNLQNQLAAGTYTVFVDATVNSTALESKFTIAVIPFDKTGLGTNDLNFPGQYLIAVDSAGNANGGSLTVTRGSVVPLTTSIPGFAIVKPDSTGTFDVIGPSGTKHTYTAPTPWARFIPVE